MIKTVIIEDDPIQMEILSDLLETYFPSIKIIAKSYNASEGIKQIIDGNAELVFLDIDLPDKSGFEVLTELRHQIFDFIFVSAHEKFAVQAHQYDSISFLLKPLSREALDQAIDKFNQKRKSLYSVMQIQSMINELKNLYDHNQKIAVPTVKEISYIRMDEIVRMEADGNYTTIFLNQSKPMIASKQIGEYEAHLAASKFFRIHDKHLVNLRFVKTFVKGESGAVMMEDNSNLPVSRRRKDQFMKALSAIVR